MPVSRTQRRYRQSIAFALNAADGHAASKAHASETMDARVSCRIPIGTHICRWPGGQESRYTRANGLPVQP